MQLFYAPDIEFEHALPQEEAQHCFKVLRKNINDEIHVVDGTGNLFTCRITENNPKKNALEIILKQANFRTRSTYLHLAIAPTKNMDRMEWMVEKAVEMGVEEISFLLCKHSERKVLKMERLEKKAISAMKQSEKAILPKLNELVPFDQFIRNCPQEVKCIAHLRDLSKDLRTYTETRELCVLIGPEGDFSTEEIDLALEHGFESVTLGKSRLRTETAGLVVCSWFVE